jgi:hypothetical protein
MNVLAAKAEVTATDVSVRGEQLHVALSDGRRVSVPLSRLPLLRDATPEQRAHWRLIGRGEGIHWPDIDEDVSVESLLRID